MTANALHKYEDEARKAGADEFLFKPLKIDELEDTINRARQALEINKSG